MAWSKQEFEIKVGKIKNLMVEECIGGVLITTKTNFRWLTGARPYVNEGSERACADILITGEGIYLISNNIEAERLIREEFGTIPVEKVEYPWWKPSEYGKLLLEVAKGKKIVTDVELGDKFTKLRWELLPEEIDRFREVSKCIANILEKVAYKISPGETEEDVATMVKKIASDYEVNPWVNLVASDERAFMYRHPLPTKKKIEKYVLMAISGEKYGLFASATRLVHFGKVPGELRKRYEAVLKVDATFIASTLPGVKVGDIFERGKKAYEDAGYKDEWENHHQGGLAGYNSREFKANSDCEEIVKKGQVYAWNPTIAGVKSEDTILVKDGLPEILTVSDNFPTKEVELDGISIKRPDILVR
ncbi:M24 family metallopeptidase [Thermovorax subterraneus]|nr:M24 family metallopeptidase [Thermovorax subterraneus]